MADTTINLGPIVALALIGFLAYRWFSYPSSPSDASSSRNAGRQINPAHVEQVAQMFPQLDRRTIIWDLQRNGGSVQATIEKLLTGRSLDTPPPSFQPPIPRPAPPANVTTTATATVKTASPDLITRYNLTSKISVPKEGLDDSAAAVGSSSGNSNSNSKPLGWSPNKADRAEALKRRREEMVLAARRRMEERDRERQQASA